MAAFVVSLVACSPPRPEALDESPGALPPIAGSTCESRPRSAGCPCDEPGRVASCGKVLRRTEDLVSCSLGSQICTSDGRWTECEGDQVAVRPAARVGSVRVLGAVSCGDECNPDCFVFADDAGIDAAGVAPADGGGVTLVPSDAARPGVDGGRECDDRPDADNLLCRQVECGDGGVPTSITGTVYDPAGTNPIPNVVVYVPNRPVAPFVEGVQADRCAVPSGRPIAYAVTDHRGRFTIRNVPAGSGIPLVLQVGKFRRQMTLPRPVTACADNSLASLGVVEGAFRLPRDRSEGDLPQLAIATGDVDPFECLLRKIGISDTEFTIPSASAPGRVHMYRENGVDMPPPGAPPGTVLTNDPSTLQRYDVVILPCEGSEYWKSDRRLDAVERYTAAGGRLFATHFSYTWLHGNGPGGTSSDPGGFGLLPHETTSQNPRSGPAAPTWSTTKKLTKPGGSGSRANGNPAPDVTISGTPANPNAEHNPLLLDITQSGGRGTAKFRWSLDDGASWSTELTTAASVSLDGTGTGPRSTYANGITVSFGNNNGNDYDSRWDWYVGTYLYTSTSRSGGAPAVNVTGDINDSGVGASFRVRIVRAGSLSSTTRMQFQYSTDDGETYSPTLDAPPLVHASGWLDYGVHRVGPGAGAGLGIVFPDVGYTTSHTFTAAPNGTITMTRIGSGPTVLLLGVPTGSYAIIVEMVQGGAHGLARYRWSADGGATWTDTNLVAVGSRTLGTTGLRVVFGSGTYVQGTQYRADTAFDKQPFRAAASWSLGRYSKASMEAYLNTAFARGKIFGDWLDYLGGTPTKYAVATLTDPRIDVMSVIPPTQQWMGDMLSNNSSPGLQVQKSAPTLPNLTVTPTATRYNGMYRITVRITQAGTVGVARFEWTANETDANGNVVWYTGGATSSSNVPLKVPGGLDTGLQIKFASGSFAYQVGQRYDVSPPVLHMTFNTPLGVAEDQKVGRVVFSDFHVSAAGSDNSKTFPASCLGGAMTAQEKALEYMLFDLAACVSVDTRPPSPPIPPYNNPASFTVDYAASCPPGQALRWGFLDWKSVTPDDSKIEFRVRTFDDASNVGPEVLVGTARGASSVDRWTGVDVGAALLAFPPPEGPVRSRRHLRVTVTLVPTSDGYDAPTLLDRRIQYTCRDAE